MFTDLMKATIGTVVPLPVAIVADAITLGGTCNNRREPYSATVGREIAKNVSNATKPERK